MSSFKLGQSSSPPPAPKEIKQLVQASMSNPVWDSLQSRSQKDLCVAYKNHILIQAEESDAQLADYSAAGLRLSFTVEREVTQTLFQNLYAFLQTNGGLEIGGLDLSLEKQYTLGMLPPLLAEQWYSLNQVSLQQCQALPENELYVSVSSASSVTLQDRALISQFLDQWQHPMAQWLSLSASAAASTLDQISKLRNIAAHSEYFLYQWQFDLLRNLVIGSDAERGLFQEIYGA